MGRGKGIWEGKRERREMDQGFFPSVPCRIMPMTLPHCSYF